MTEVHHFSDVDEVAGVLPCGEVLGVYWGEE